jgi:ubiquinone/menaquinone biosynthesis C-methylase UbiE
MKFFNTIILSLLVLLSALMISCQGNQSVESPFDSTDRPALEDYYDSPDDSSRNDSASDGINEDYINTNRVLWQKPQMIIELMGNLDDKVVADLGAGGRGFFSLRLAAKAKKVIALDTEEAAIKSLDTIRQLQLPERLQPKLEIRLTPADEPNLKENEVDVVFISNVYIYLPDRVGYMKKLRSLLKDAGKVMIVDFKKKSTPIGPNSSFRVPLYIVEQELAEAGYKNIQTNDTALDYQYIVIAEK